jgi:hypothetical protein
MAAAAGAGSPATLYTLPGALDDSEAELSSNTIIANIKYIITACYDHFKNIITALESYYTESSVITADEFIEALQKYAYGLPFFLRHICVGSKLTTKQNRQMLSYLCEPTSAHKSHPSLIVEPDFESLIRSMLRQDIYNKLSSQHSQGFDDWINEIITRLGHVFVEAFFCSDETAKAKNPWHGPIPRLSSYLPHDKERPEIVFGRIFTSEDTPVKAIQELIDATISRSGCRRGRGTQRPPTHPSIASSEAAPSRVIAGAGLRPLGPVTIDGRPVTIIASFGSHGSPTTSDSSGTPLPAAAIIHAPLAAASDALAVVTAAPGLPIDAASATHSIPVDTGIIDPTLPPVPAQAGAGIVNLAAATAAPPLPGPEVVTPCDCSCTCPWFSLPQATNLPAQPTR